MAEQDDQVLLTEIELKPDAESSEQTTKSDEVVDNLPPVLGENTPNGENQQTESGEDIEHRNGYPSYGEYSKQGEAGENDDLMQVLSMMTPIGSTSSVEENAGNALDDVTYIEPVPDPYDKAIVYLEKHSILQLFQQLTTGIVYNRPNNPIDYMMDEVQQIIKNRNAPEQE